MDAVAVEVAIEGGACRDRRQAEASLAAALAASRGPRRSGAEGSRWHLQVNVDTAKAGITSATATLEDDVGSEIASRTLTDKAAGRCAGLARAVGAWAQMVLDEELARADEPITRDDTPVEPPVVMTSSQKVERDQPPNGGSNGPRTVEVGAMLFLRNGTTRVGGVFGASPFFTVTFGDSWVLRPSLAFGTSFELSETKDPVLTSLGGRLDVCRRIPGNYIDRRGIEFDACAGGDSAYVYGGGASAVRASAGPSFVLRGELGANIGIEVRGMVGANLAREGLGAPPPFVVGSAEIGGSARFR